MTTPYFSIVIPIYNEEKNIVELHKQLTSVMGKMCEEEMDKNLTMDRAGASLDGSYEIIMVDDGSTDHSWQIIKELHDKDRRIKGISFSRNFGHHIAITAGLDHAKGEAVILMDGDLQDPPQEIPKLFKKFKEGHDFVYGIRTERKDSFTKKFSSYLFWKVIRLLSGFDIPGNQSMLRIMTRRYLDNFKKFTEKNRFLPGLFTWAGFDQVAVKIEHGKRYEGKSKYNLWRLVKLAFHAVTSFSYIPLQVAGLVGVIIAAISFILGIWLIIKKLVWGIPVVGWASTLVSILFIGGVQLAVLGLIGEYLGRIFSEVQNRPLYIIKEATRVGE